MSLNDKESPTTPEQPSSSSTLPTSNLSVDLSTAEIPLFGLVQKPRDQMTAEELRERVLRIQQLRTSPQTLRAAVEERDPADKNAVEKLKATLGDYV